ncbi:hypothetical protein [Riemerella columbipharyngis]|uniref:YD repeat-containing protein n=1 Tax=Riemerella columbipharyngis TaxID=1071918 RepID=A0A1G7BR78_9FLAO|nr:hypothetical protein [Riemerella columbipharyngis]SDE29579.1 hypothetical protein SAMN05421544_10692 [Riemerella columbipharyngis]
MEHFGKIEKGIFFDNDIYIYDNKGNKIDYTSYNADGSLTKKETYQYYNKGNLVEYNMYNTNSSLFSKYIFKYYDNWTQAPQGKLNRDNFLQSQQ